MVTFKLLPWIVGSAFVVTSVIVQQVVNRTVAYPYMDEPFHLNQTVAYCNNDFARWDSKITTFPGLYIVALGYVWLLTSVQYVVGMCGDSTFSSCVASTCSLDVLRSVNLIFESLTFVVVYKLTTLLHPRLTDYQHAVKTLLLCSFPVLYFFNFLYYTDSGSTFFVLATHYLYLQNRTLAGFMSACMAVFVRQTNIVWVAFSGAVSILKSLEDHKEALVKKDDRTARKSGSLVVDVQDLVAFIFKHPRTIIQRYWGLILIATCFGVFVVVNKGIVVGDRSAHAPVFHFTQFLYFFGFYIFMNVFASDTWRLQQLSSTLKNPINLLYLTGSMAICAVLVHLYSPVHPYILADNRHFTFYLWKNILGRFSYAKLVFLPGYFYAMWVVWLSLRTSGYSSLWCLSHFVCTFVVLTPAHLLEFRYFLIPSLLVKLHTRESNTQNLLHQLIWFAMINLVTLLLFVKVTFKWPSEENLMRFMW